MQQSNRRQLHEKNLVEGELPPCSKATGCSCGGARRCAQRETIRVDDQQH